MSLTIQTVPSTKPPTRIHTTQGTRKVSQSRFSTCSSVVNFAASTPMLKPKTTDLPSTRPETDKCDGSQGTAQKETRGATRSEKMNEVVGSLHGMDERLQELS